MDVAVDLVVFAWSDGGWQLLLIERRYPPFMGSWALPGGFVDPDEDLSDAALRELEEETGVRLNEVLQVGAFGSPKRDPRKRVVSVAYSAVLASAVLAHAGDDAAKAKWFSLQEIPTLAFDHFSIIERALSQIKDKYTLEQDLPTENSLSEAARKSMMQAQLTVQE